MSTLKSRPEFAYGEHCFTLFTDNAVSGANGLAIKVILSTTAVFVVVSSLTMLVGLWKTNKTLTTVKRILFFLCLIDMTIGVLVAPLQTLMADLASKAHCPLIQLQAFCNVFFPLISGEVLLLLVFIRYHKIADTKFHKFFANRKFIYTMIFLATFLASLVAVWYILNRKKTENWSHAYFFITAGIYSAVLLAGIIIMNLKLLRFMKVTAGASLATQQQGVVNYRKGVTKTILMMSVSIVICYLPLTIIFLTSGATLLRNDHEAMDVIFIIVPWSQVPVLINSGMNSAIYVTRTKSIKRYYRSLLSLKHPVVKPRSESSYSSRYESSKANHIRLHDIGGVSVCKVDSTRC